MARIRMLSAEEFPASLRELVGADTKTPLELGNIRFYAHRPELAEAYVRFRGETHQLLPLTSAAEAADPLTRHVGYSQIGLRAEYPVVAG